MPTRKLSRPARGDRIQRRARPFDRPTGWLPRCSTWSWMHPTTVPTVTAARLFRPYIGHEFTGEPRIVAVSGAPFGSRQCRSQQTLLSQPAEHRFAFRRLFCGGSSAPGLRQRALVSLVAIRLAAGRRPQTRLSHRCARQIPIPACDCEARRQSMRRLRAPAGPCALQECVDSGVRSSPGFRSRSRRNLAATR